MKLSNSSDKIPFLIIIISFGINISKLEYGSFYFTPPYFAALNGQYKILQILHKEGCNICFHEAE